MTATIRTYVDAALTLRGAKLPLDHGYALFAAISGVCPQVHTESRWGIHPVFGQRQSPGTLLLGPRSLLKIRLPVEDIGALLPLVGARLRVRDDDVVLGGLRVFPLISAPALKARFVTIKGFYEETAAFADAFRRQLAKLPDLQQDPERVEVSVAGRRVMRVGDHTVVGFSVALVGLDASASIAVQSHGLGGRRHMGAGIFCPMPKRAK